MENKIPILILTGPTAVGKTDLSIKLAKILNAEIISADSMQIYRYMDIGSAKVSPQEMNGVVHHMIDIIDPDQDFSVSEFKDRAEAIIEDIHSRDKLAIITGGTGLYLNSILFDMDFGQSESDPKIRKELENILEEKGIDYLHSILEEISPKTAERIHKNNTKRVIRAIEVYRSGGELGDFSKDLRLNEKYQAHTIVLNRDRVHLYERINYRVDLMFDNGLLDEVQELHKKGYTKDMTSMKGIGYKEVLDYFDGLVTLEDAKNSIKQSSRRYAKRQITWFKKYPDALWIDLDEISEINDQISMIKDFLKNK
ncbi:tRNA delta(2)-isopentenylpyrophosphate transferase [Peptostreptococcus sp. MV1]|uniref:tRNA (adenosine(37)-N6)-dimethylallyltransferase MiaA n=1 Tax=Peptostreptococcus sp. MV1 TaxID=1219626 RepID=UPI00050DEAC4|nr:tRNA (adenosine(37)-N6)-dimethylallyltransferase MiaA [Peptostreptococcus sp. MV1]KGF15664.1 tRNA delta(2)-isopentenylpyrophosphate transferase [Peptostreptococcus sp. MV1]